MLPKGMEKERQITKLESRRKVVCPQQTICLKISNPNIFLKIAFNKLVHCFETTSGNVSSACMDFLVHFEFKFMEGAAFFVIISFIVVCLSFYVKLFVFSILSPRS